MFGHFAKDGSIFGYHLANCHITTNERLSENAKQVFVHDKVEKVDGCRVLGSVVNSDNGGIELAGRSLKQQNSLFKKPVFMSMFQLKMFIIRLYNWFIIN